MKSLIAACTIVGLGALGLAAFGCNSDDPAAPAGAGGASTGNGGSGTNGGSSSSSGGTTGTCTAASADCPNSVAWYDANIGSVKTEGRTSPTAPGQKAANAWGLYDVQGNAVEWVEDCYHADFNAAPTDGKAWTATTCEKYVARGGCSTQPATSTRLSARQAVDPTGYGGCNATVRCVADASATTSGPFEWATVTGGKFTMGCSNCDADCLADEKPAHEVTVGNFKIMKKEPTQKEFYDQMAVYTTNEDCATCAVEAVPHDQAQAFCTKLGGRLPTEAEWEYAARAGATTRYTCGN